ncbi:MAG: hypothetical protein R2854_26150 [Caldilineaceae bacterium]
MRDRMVDHAGAQDRLLAVLAPALLLATMAVDAILNRWCAPGRCWFAARLALGMATLVLVPLIWAGVRGLETVDVAGPGQSTRHACTHRSRPQAARSWPQPDADTVPDTGPLLVLPADVLRDRRRRSKQPGQWLDAGNVQPLTLANILDGVDHPAALHPARVATGWTCSTPTSRAASRSPNWTPHRVRLRHWIVGITPGSAGRPRRDRDYADAAADVEVVLRRTEPGHPPGRRGAARAEPGRHLGTLRVDTADGYRFDVTGLG